MLGRTSHSIERRKRGFALIITLSLISFVFLLVITLISQVRLELAFSDVRQEQVLAKAHARMGMMIALGEIQKHLGPDMRISATADIYDERAESTVAYETSQYPQSVGAQDQIDLTEDGSVRALPFGQRMWTGVWKHRGHGSDNYLEYEGFDPLATRELPFNSDKGNAITQSWSVDVSYDSHPAVEAAWLVSGNEGWQRKPALTSSGTGLLQDFVEVPDGIYVDDGGVRVIPGSSGGNYGKEENAWRDHEEVVRSALSNYNHPLVDLDDPEDDDSVAWVLKAPVQDSEGLFVGEPVKVPKTKVLDSLSREAGAYAYWVGDEGVKAKVNLSVPQGLNYASKLQVASAPLLGASTEAAFSKKDILSLSAVGSLGALSGKTSEEAENWAAAHFHDLGVDSFGVLADLRTGGLKRDLSLAFSVDQEDELWKKDFNNNWIFRDRVECLKNFPMYSKQSKDAFNTTKVHKNQWFDQVADATVQDGEALLAGPQWAMLYDFHNLSKDGELELAPPSQFPRIVGDNAIMFKPGQSPESPGGAFSPVADAQTLRFFNCFKDRYDNAVRPEPNNHPIAPVLTRIKLGMYWAIKNPSTNEVVIALNPSVSLWNPYDKPMRLKDLFVYLPARQGAPFNIAHFDLAEYDLFRKWWMYVSAAHETKWKYDKLNVTKDWTQPWGLFEYSLFDGTKDTANLTEFGVLTAVQSGSSYISNGSPKMDLSVETRLLDGKMQKVYVYQHERPVEGAKAEFVFTSWKSTRLNNGSVKVNDLYLQIEDAILAPGECAGFNVVELQEKEYEPNKPISIALGKGAETDAYLVGTGEKDFQFGSIDFSFNGFSGLGAGNSDSLVYQNGFQYSPAANYKLPCITMYQWKGAASAFDPENSRDARKIFTVTYSTSDNTGRADQVKLITREHLKQNWEDRNDDANDVMPGVGNHLEMVLSGDKRNERVTLNDFNLRHVVHSDQHGMGRLYYDRVYRKRAHAWMPGDFTSDGRGVLHFRKGMGAFSLNTPDDDDDLVTNTFTVPDDTSRPVYQDPLTQGRSPTSATKDKSFPDFYLWSGSQFDEAGWTAIEAAFDSASRSSDLEARRSALGFVQGPDWGLRGSAGYPENLLLDPHMNSKVTRSKQIPRWDDSLTHAGFNHDSRDRLSNQSEMTLDKQAVLFATPSHRVLSLLEYRHANLNSYLHGPSYALGNSYASTQVARHRSWGRVQMIEHVPTSERGLTVKDIANMDKYQLQYLNDHLQLPEYKNLGRDKLEIMLAMTNWGSTGGWGFGNYWHGIDLNQGFAAWRKDDSGSQLNHQNTTIDHSFYLNRALLDGYFLSGLEQGGVEAEISELEAGQRYKPFLFGTSEGEKSGNHRLVAYHRDGEWNHTSYGKRSLEEGNSNEKDSVYRYQSLAGDLLVDGAFNVNSTSVEAWVAQLSSLRGAGMRRKDGSAVALAANETPVVRFIEEPEEQNSWNRFRKLSDAEIVELAKAMVRQVKLRGPFLSFSDFVNRRLAPGPQDPLKAKGSFVNFMEHELSKWENEYPETRDTSTGLRGALQSAIADAGLNDPDSWGDAGLIPQVPSARWNGANLNVSEFGLIGSSKQSTLWNGGNRRYWGQGAFPPGYELPGWTKRSKNHYGMIVQDGSELPNVKLGGLAGYKFRPDKNTYLSSDYGEAPENLLAVEHLATAANKPGWVMQADLLSPLAPVVSARSDTFVVRVMGETGSRSSARAWIELVVQRTPDYVKADLDAPHHRPHEPFKDENFNGYWDNGFGEEWIDLNRNGDKKDYPDVPGDSESRFRDGMLSDLRLNLDPQEEDLSTTIGLSFQGINQRFGRKFKIVKFRWLREQDV